MRVAITGSRYLKPNHVNKVLIENTDNKYVTRTFRDILDGMYFDLFADAKDYQLIFIAGGATGADQLIKEWCKVRDVMFEEYPANWASEGKAAGPVRNQKMAEKCDYCLAFPIVGLKNKGTTDMIQRCQALGKHVDIYWMEV